MPAELVVPHFRQATHYHPGRIKAIRLGVIHVGVTPESITAAEGMVDFAASPGASIASFHLAADPDSLARGVHDWDTAFGAPGANADGLHMEQAGQVMDHAGWTTPLSLKMIREQTARGVKSWHDLYGIPLVHLSLAQVGDGKTKGFCSHWDVTKGIPAAGGTHTDPDNGAVPGYPWDVVFTAADQHPSLPPATHKNPFNHLDDLVRWTQWALGIPVDGKPGAETKAALAALRKRNHIDPALSYPDPKSIAVLSQITH
ncbi:MAG: hypothetical protein JWP11_49 [Frankiales bacterium]|nr:hypothetical protein [Frankiales bacterium]